MPTTAEAKTSKASMRWCGKTPSCAKRVTIMRVIQPYRGWLARVRRCESGGNYATNTGNGFYGAYQFVVGTWHGIGGRGLPHQASRREQDYRAVLLMKRSGPGQWPVCGR